MTVQHFAVVFCKSTGGFSTSTKMKNYFESRIPVRMFLDISLLFPSEELITDLSDGYLKNVMITSTVSL